MSILVGNLSLTSSSGFLQAESLDGALFVPDIKLHSNPSAFNVYCNVRHCVLDWQQKEASLALASRTSVQSGDSDSEEEEEYREPAVKLPKVRPESFICCEGSVCTAWFLSKTCLIPLGLFIFIVFI